MPNNCAGTLIKQLGRLWPARLGMLFSPAGWATPSPYIPFAMDNGAFSAYIHQTEWNEEAWTGMLWKAKATNRAPAWALVPDKVADKEETIRLWHHYAPMVRDFGFATAFAVQDGMVRQDVPTDPAPDVIFVGGTTEWKWRMVPSFSAWFPRVHVGRVNTLPRVLQCEEYGVESCDGSGWFRGNPQQTRELIQWVVGVHTENMRLFYFDRHEKEDDVEIPAEPSPWTCSAGIEG